MSEKAERKRKKLLEWYKKQPNQDEEPIENEDEEKPTEEEKASAWLESQRFGESKSIPIVEEVKIDPERIKDRIIDDINEMSENEEILRQESERQIAELDEGIKSFIEFLAEVKSNTEDALEKAEKEGKLKSEEMDRKIMKAFERIEKDVEERNKGINRLLKKISETETKRRKVIERLEVETEKVIAENKKLVTENKRILSQNKEIQLDKEKIDAENKRILRENEEIRKKNKKIGEINKRRR